MGRLFQYNRFTDDDQNKDIIRNKINQKMINNNASVLLTKKSLKKKLKNFDVHPVVSSDYEKLLKISKYDNNNYRKDIKNNISLNVVVNENENQNDNDRDKDGKKAKLENLRKDKSKSRKNKCCGEDNLKFYSYMKDFLRRKLLNNSRCQPIKQKKATAFDVYHQQPEEDIYVELPNCIKMINNNLSYEKNSNDNHINNRYEITRPDINSLRVDANHTILRNGSPSLKRRPIHLFSHSNLNCNDNEKIVQTPSSDEDNSPTEMNNCKRLVDKPPLVKRLTMGFLRSHDNDHRPLVHPTTIALKNSSIHTLSNGYVNEGNYEPEKFISSKFGDSCRQSLTAIPMLDKLNLNDNAEFNLKKKYLRETSSANSSPKIFASRMRMNSYSSTTTATSSQTITTEEIELKDAPWFQAGISREIALEILSRDKPGAFLVRKSTSKTGCYALSLRLPSPPGPKVAHYIILRTQRGYKIKGFRKEFTTLKALVTHHSVMPELLPVPLTLPRPANLSSSRRNLDDFDTYDSLQLLGILKMLRAKNLDNE